MEKVGLKLNIQKTKIMVSGPITSWQIDGETVETVADSILGTPKSLQMVTAAMKFKVTYSFIFFCSAYRVIINIFLNSIYMC